MKITKILKSDNENSQIIFVVMLFHSFLLRMTSAPMTPGTHPQRVRMRTMRMDPHPRSMTARGGKKMARRTRKRDIVVIF